MRIEVHQSPYACWATCDPGAVARIVRILLDNAIGIAPAGSTVQTDTETAADGSWSQLTVSDNGPGVPRAEREQIFERFQRGSTSGGHSGFGLGLAIGRELASRMAGALTLLEDRADMPATGACFALRLPPARIEQDHDSGAR